MKPKSLDELFFKSISEANGMQLDILWALLKYRNIGIYRKVACMCEVLGIEFEDIVEYLPNENGRVLDKATRKLIHENLVELS